MTGGRRATGSAVGSLVVALALAGCGAGAKARTGAAPQDVAGRFAAAVLRGDAAAARGLLVRRDEAALVFLVRRAAAPWRTGHASFQLPARRSGDGWAVRFVGRHTQSDGRFETERGDLVVFVSRSAAGAGVRFFLFAHMRVRFGTHHDSQLLPSVR